LRYFRTDAAQHPESDELIDLIPPHCECSLLDQLADQLIDTSRFSNRCGVNPREISRNLFLPISQRDIRRIDVGIVLEKVRDNVGWTFPLIAQHKLHSIISVMCYGSCA